MEKNERKEIGIKAPVKKISKEITKSNIQKIIKELTHRSLKEKIGKLEQNEIQTIEQKLINLSEQEKIEHFSDCIDKITRKISNGEMDDKELIQEISKEIEKKLAVYFPEPLPSNFNRIKKWSKVPIFSVMIVIAISIAAIVLFAFPNSSPEAYINSTIPDAPVYRGTQMDISGYGIDPDKNDMITEYQWESDLDGLLGSSNILKISMLSAGKHILTFKVKDNHNEWSEPKTFNIEIIENRPATAHIDSINPKIIYTGIPITFSGHGEDPDKNDSITSYEWSLNNTILSNSATFASQSLPVGTLTIQFRVGENNGEWSQPVVAKIEILNHKPVANINSIAPNVSFYGTQLTFSGHGDDQDKNDLIISYEWNISNIKFGSSAIFSSKNISVGKHVVMLRVMDSHGAWSEPAFSSIEIMPYAKFRVFSEKDMIVPNGLCDDGVKNCAFSNNISGGGYYAKVGNRVALNGKQNKLADILIEWGVAEWKNLTIGETLPMNPGYDLTINAINAKGSPKWVQVTLNKDGAKVDEAVVNQGEVYEYSKKSLAGESDVPVFVTYIDSVIPGVNSDMVQLRYTWGISENVTVI